MKNISKFNEFKTQKNIKNEKFIKESVTWCTHKKKCTINECYFNDEMCPIVNGLVKPDEDCNSTNEGFTGRLSKFIGKNEYNKTLDYIKRALLNSEKYKSYKVDKNILIKDAVKGLVQKIKFAKKFKDNEKLLNSLVEEIVKDLKSKKHGQINEAKKEKTFIIYSEKRGKENKHEGTLKELISKFSYTLKIGQSWEHEKGNKKININPKGIKSLMTALNNSKSNAVANGNSDTYYFLK